MYLVTGATGNAGNAVVHALVQDGHAVRALVRDVDHPTLPSGVEKVVGDLNRPSTFKHALEGVTAVFLLSGYDKLIELLDEAGAAGVERVVLLSGSAAQSGDLGNLIAREHMLSEQAIRMSRLAWTFLQPNSFMTNTLLWADQVRRGDVVRAPFGDVAIATLHPSDLAEVAVRALVTDELEGQSLRMSGPEALQPEQQVRRIGAALGRPLRFEPLPDAAAWTEMCAIRPTDSVDALFSLFADGIVDESSVLPTVHEVTGRAPMNFDVWASSNVEAFT